MGEYDPTILQNFTKEISTCPDEQAAAAVQVVKNVLDKSDKDIAPLMDELTMHQMDVVTNTIEKIMGNA